MSSFNKIIIITIIIIIIIIINTIIIINNIIKPVIIKLNATTKIENWFLLLNGFVTYTIFLGFSVKCNISDEQKRKLLELSWFIAIMLLQEKLSKYTKCNYLKLSLINNRFI